MNANVPTTRTICKGLWTPVRPARRGSGSAGSHPVERWMQTEEKGKRIREKDSLAYWIACWLANVYQKEQSTNKLPEGAEHGQVELKEPVSVTECAWRRKSRSRTRQKTLIWHSSSVPGIEALKTLQWVKPVRQVWKPAKREYRDQSCADEQNQESKDKSEWESRASMRHRKQTHPLGEQREEGREGRNDSTDSKGDPASNVKERRVSNETTKHRAQRGQTREHKRAQPG